MSSSKPKVLITRSDIPQKALDILKEKCEVEIFPEPFPIPRDELLKRIQGKDGLICLITDNIDKEILDAAGKNLKVICTMSVGYDHLDLSEMKARKIKVAYTPDISTDAVAELTVALLLAAGRRLFQANNEILNGGWAKCSWSPLWMTGQGLATSTVGIFGLGRIGLGVLKRLQGFNVAKFLYNDCHREKEGEELGAEFVSFDDLLTQSDFVIITAALTEDTKEIFNAEAFSKMKPTTILVNISRGGLVDQDALVAALKGGQIRAAGLDVMTPEPLPPNHPLVNTPNLILLPHIGSAETTTREGMANMTVNNIIAGLNDSTMPQRLC